MPNRFDHYRMRDGVTPLAERYFNRVWQDIDLRLATLEELKVAWEVVVRTVTDFGLVRINEALAPAFEVMSQQLTEAQADAVEIEAKRQAAVAALAQLQTAIASFEGEADADIEAWKAAALIELEAWKSNLIAGMAVVPVTSLSVGTLAEGEILTRAGGALVGRRLSAARPFFFSSF